MPVKPAAIVLGNKQECCAEAILSPSFAVDHLSDVNIWTEHALWRDAHQWGELAAIRGERHLAGPTLSDVFGVMAVIGAGQGAEQLIATVFLPLRTP